MTDFTIGGDASIGLVYPQNEQAAEYLRAHTPQDAQWFGRGLVIEWRYAEDLVNGLRGDGFTVKLQESRDAVKSI